MSDSGLHPYSKAIYYAFLANLAIAFAFVLAASITGNPVHDAIGSICTGTILIIVAVFAGWRVKELLIGRSAEPELEFLTAKIFTEDEHIECLLSSITLQFGPQVMLAAILTMKPGISIDIAVEQINKPESKIKQQVPTVDWCFMESDIVKQAYFRHKLACIGHEKLNQVNDMRCKL